MKGRTSYLECFPTTINEYSEYTWQNDEYGAMILEVVKDDLSVDEYFFGYANMEGEEGERNKRIWQERANKKMHLICSGRPILFGIAAYWILHHKGIAITNLYENYLRDKIDAYKRKHEQEVSSRKRNIELDFYANYIVPKEIEKNRMSKEIFDYITPQETKQLKEIMGDFIDYLKEKRTEMGYVENPQLKVLRYLDSGDKSVLEDMPDFEFNTICTELEKGGYIKVAWVEGHVPEDVKLLDKGRFYMEQLEKEGVAKKMQRSEDYKPTYINEQHNNNCQQFFYPISNCTFMMLPASPSAKKTSSKKGGSNSSSTTTPKPELQHGVEYPVFSKGSGVTDDHIKALYRLLTARGWISTQTKEADFFRLFSGKSNDCEIIWTGQDKLGDNKPTTLGVSALYVLFKDMFDEGLITTSSKAQKVGPILEKHFVNTDGHFLTNVSNVSTTSAKANDYIKLIKNTMRMRPSSEYIQRLLEEDMESKRDKNDCQDLNYRKPR